jgi:hypothetical protein
VVSRGVYYDQELRRAGHAKGDVHALGLQRVETMNNFNGGHARKGGREEVELRGTAAAIERFCSRHWADGQHGQKKNESENLLRRLAVQGWGGQQGQVPSWQV